MRLILKNRWRYFIVLTIYLNAIFEFILPTNGSVRDEATRVLTQPYNSPTRLEHLLLLGTYSYNKARSPLIKSIVPDGSNTKQPYVVRVAVLPEKVINVVASTEYHTDNRKNIKKSNNSRLKIIIPWNGRYDKDSFGWIRRHIQNKLLFAVTSRSGARGNDLSFVDFDHGKPNNSSSLDISHIGTDIDSGWDKVSKGESSDVLSFKTNHNTLNTSHRIREVINQTKLIPILKHQNSIADETFALNVKTEKVVLRRYKRGSGEEQHLLKNISKNRTGVSENRTGNSKGRLPTGTDIYYKLLKYINQYLNMSTDIGNFSTNTVPWVIEIHCPDVIKELYRTIKAPGK